MNEVVPSDESEQARFDEPALRTRYHSGGWTLAAVLVAWVLVVSGGLSILWRYEHAEGSIAPSPQQWPAGTQLQRSADRATIVFFAHPQCPCTRASIEELARLMADCNGRADTLAIFVKPSQFADRADWEKTKLWNAAERIPGVTALVDIDGAEAERFQAKTSGIVMLYDQAGKLRFRGGITASRGHSGDNLGRSSIAEFLNQGHTQVDSTKVYGCELSSRFGRSDSTCCQ